VRLYAIECALHRRHDGVAVLAADQSDDTLRHHVDRVGSRRGILLIQTQCVEGGHGVKVVHRVWMIGVLGNTLLQQLLRFIVLLIHRMQLSLLQQQTTTRADQLATLRNPI
jgi:hypothetical protein